MTEMVKLLLSAGANPNARTRTSRTALSAHVRFCGTPSVECVTALLRAGASLDRVYEDHPFEYHFPFIEDRNGREFCSAIRILTAGIRRNGSFKRYVREPHREVLRLRSLLVRGRARGTLRTEPRIRWLLKLPNDPLWHVLSYWRATE